jgi:hypothetical protein
MVYLEVFWSKFENDLTESEDVPNNQIPYSNFESAIN